MKPWDKAFIQVVTYAALAAVAVKLGLTPDIGAAFVALCMMGFLAFLCSTCHLWR